LKSDLKLVGTDYSRPDCALNIYVCSEKRKKNAPVHKLTRASSLPLPPLPPVVSRMSWKDCKRIAIKTDTTYRPHRESSRVEKRKRAFQPHVFSNHNRLAPRFDRSLSTLHLSDRPCAAAFETRNNYISPLARWSRQVLARARARAHTRPYLTVEIRENIVAPFHAYQSR